MEDKDWFQLSPNNNDIRWWRITDLIDQTYIPNEDEIECYFIIQDGNMSGNFWYVSSWYLNCPNRYADIIYHSTWKWNKPLTSMTEGDVVYLSDNSNIIFKVYDCPHAYKEQQPFCKILERIK